MNNKTQALRDASKTRKESLLNFVVFVKLAKNHRQSSSLISQQSTLLTIASTFEKITIDNEGLPSRVVQDFDQSDLLTLKREKWATQSHAAKIINLKEPIQPQPVRLPHSSMQLYQYLYHDYATWCLVYVELVARVGQVTPRAVAAGIENYQHCNIVQCLSVVNIPLKGHSGAIVWRPKPGTLSGRWSIFAGTRT